MSKREAIVHKKESIQFTGLIPRANYFQRDTVLSGPRVANGLSPTEACQEALTMRANLHLVQQ